jgi:predicted DCC family thiol-disulfide oxidoreductase YuxK
MSKKENLILFDGICNLCNGFVNFIIDRDKKGVFMFGTLQQERVKDMLEIMGLQNYRQSVIYIESGKTYTESTAALKILKKLGGLWSMAYVFVLIPKFIRDFIYRLIARNRYKWFGKRARCRMPESEITARFIP